MKKYYILFIIFLAFNQTFAQTNLPAFLHGTWKIENEEIYEHWDQLNDHTLKGFSYRTVDGKMAISEYLEIYQNQEELIYSATVLNQNQGNEIKFKLTRNDSVLTFENPNHEFPKKITYQKINPNEVLVRLSGTSSKEFAFKMIKQIKTLVETDSSLLNPQYDAELAKKLGADDYGMKRYILVMLKTGTNDTTDKTFINNCFREHLLNIGRLVNDGKLIVAGPLGKNDNLYRGIFILNVANIDEAEQLLQTDMAIKEGLLAFELYNWFGSAALPEYLEFSDKIWKVKP